MPTATLALDEPARSTLGTTGALTEDLIVKLFGDTLNYRTDLARMLAGSVPQAQY